MDWLDKIPKWIQIPLKILLPALCIFSGFLLLISDELATKLYLKDFRQHSGFAFGIIFSITLSLILVYIIFFATKPLCEKLKKHLTKKKVIKEFKKLEEVYKKALYTMYKSPTLSGKMYLSSSIATYLLNINAVNRGDFSAGGMVFDFYLQPWIIWGIESEIKDAEKFTRKFEKNELKLQKNKKFNLYQERYNKDKKFLKFIKSPLKK